MKMHLLCALAPALALCGCATTSTLETSLREPTFAIVGSGVQFEGRYIMPKEALKILKAHKVPKDTVIYVRVEDMEGTLSPVQRDGMKFNEGKAKIASSARLREAQAFMALLWRGGYHKSVLVTEEKSSAWSTGK